MKGINFGGSEEPVLLTALMEEPNSIVIGYELSNHTGRSANLGLVPAVLNRFEENRLVKSELGEATKTLSGKLAIPGRAAVVRAKSVRDRVWNSISWLGGLPGKKV